MFLCFFIFYSFNSSKISTQFFLQFSNYRQNYIYLYLKVLAIKFTPNSICASYVLKIHSKE
jgi:hypothetical protein